MSLGLVSTVALIVVSLICILMLALGVAAIVLLADRRKHQDES